MLQHPAQEGAVEAARFERQVGGIGALELDALLQPRHLCQMRVGGSQLALVEVDAGDPQLGEAAQQDLALRTDAAAYFEDVAGVAEVDVMEDRRFEQACLLAQPLLFVCREAMQVGEVVESHGNSVVQ